MKKSTIFIAFLFIGIINLTAQSEKVKFGLSIHAGISQIQSDIRVPAGPFSTGGYESKLGAAGGIGVFFEKSLSEKSIIGLEILGIHATGKDKFYFQENFSLIEEDFSYHYNDDSSLSLSYLAFPVYYKFKIRKFAIKAGLQPMIFLFGNSKYVITEIFDNSEFQYQDEDADFKVKRFVFGPILGLEYMLNELLALKLTGYFGLLKIEKTTPYKDSNSGKFGIYTLGVNCYFNRKPL